MVSRSVQRSFVAVCVSGVACSALADPPPSYGFDFATVGAVNNPGTTFTLPGGDRSVGSVGYEYRISKTEVVTSQWLEFVRAYAPYKAGQPASTPSPAPASSTTPDSGNTSAPPAKTTTPSA